jgi:hypothetical protein
VYVRSAVPLRSSTAPGIVLSPSRAELARCTCARHSHRGLRPLPGSSFHPRERSSLGVRALGTRIADFVRFRSRPSASPGTSFPRGRQSDPAALRRCECSRLARKKVLDRMLLLSRTNILNSRCHLDSRKIRALCRIPSYPRHVTPASRRRILRDTPFDCALSGPFDNVFLA